MKKHVPNKGFTRRVVSLSLVLYLASEGKMLLHTHTHPGIHCNFARRPPPPKHHKTQNKTKQQVSDRSTENRVLAQLLMSIMEDPYYDSLRTKQQLGYLVFSGVKLVEGVSYMYLLVQSAERDPAYITDRSLEFLEGFRQELVDLPTSKLRCGDRPTTPRLLFLLYFFATVLSCVGCHCTFQCPFSCCRRRMADRPPKPLLRAEV